MRQVLDYQNPKVKYERPVRRWEYVRDVSVVSSFVAIMFLIFRWVALGSLADALFDW
jgi:hypothetical protein